MTTSRPFRSALTVVVVAALALAGCSSEEKASTRAGGASVGESPNGPRALSGDGVQSFAVDAADPVAVSGQSATGAGSGGSVLVETTNRKMIYEADLVVRVDQPGAKADEAARIAQKAGGVVFEQREEAEGDAYLVLKVPPARLDAVLSGLTGLGKQVSKRVGVSDVTAQAVDIDARLAAAKSSAERLRTLLSGAPKVEDLVRIESELAQREATVESLTAQQRELNQRVDMATVNLTLSRRAVAKPADDLPGFLGGLRRGAVALVDAGTVALAGLGFALPFLAVLLALWLVALRPVVRMRRGRRSAGGPAQAAEPTSGQA